MNRTNYQRNMQSFANNNQHPTTLTPGEHLVLAAMKLKPSARDIARMEAYVNEVTDWEYVTQLAIDRGIGPMLNHKIPMLINKHLIPADAQQRLQQSYLRTLARGMRLYEAFREVGTALNKAGIKFVALKGVYLAEALYQDIGLRLFSDIDLLVAEEDGERALEVLRGKGFTSHGEETVQTRFIEEHMEVVHYLPMVKGDVSVEIHIKLHRDEALYRFNIPQMLHDVESVQISEIQASVLRFYDLLIHLCVHADKHFRNGYVQFTGYCDILNLALKHQDKIDWDAFQGRCKMHGCEDAVFAQLKLLESFHDLEIPIYEIKTALIDTEKDEFMFKAYLRGQKMIPGYLTQLRKTFKRYPTLWGKIRYVWGLTFPEKAFMVNRYKIKNPANYRVYYFVRVWDVVKRLMKLG